MKKINSIFESKRFKAIRSFFSKINKRVFLTVLGIITGVIIVLLLSISIITKWLIEKYDVQFIGREITLGWVYVNPITGYANMKNVKVYEFESDSVFFSTNSISINISMLKLFSKTIEISKLKLKSPHVIISQNKKAFNFDDLIDRFKPKDDADTTESSMRFSILNVKIQKGEIHYRESETPIDYFITKFDFDSPGKRWDADTVTAQFSFLSGIGTGKIRGVFNLAINSLNYRLGIMIENFSLDLLKQYLQDMSSFGTYEATLDSRLSVIGNFKDAKAVSIRGMISLNDFHIGKTSEEKYASFDTFSVGIIELSPNNHKYLFDSISLINPYFKYERYNHTDNLSAMFGDASKENKTKHASGEKFNLIFTIGNYIAELSQNFFKSNYLINSLKMDSGYVEFNDFSLPEKFSMGLSKIDISADSIDIKKKKVNLELSTQIVPYGNIHIGIGLNPQDSSQFDLHYEVKGVSLPQFNPYSVTYTSFPFDRGTIELKGKWDVQNGYIDSKNNLIILDPRVTKRLKNDDSQWIPVPLIMAIVKERGNVIDYDVPIKGSLKDPDFKIKDIVLDLLENIFIKPISLPYIVHVKNTERVIEKSLFLRWPMRSTYLSKRQEKFIEKMVDFLVDNPKSKIEVYPKFYHAKEKEYTLFFEAKKMFLLSNNTIEKGTFSEKDSLKVVRLSVKDSMFVQYVDKMSSDNSLFTMQEKCSRFVNANVINSELSKLQKARKRIFVSFFKDEDVDNRLVFSAAENTVPYNGFSSYDIKYQNEFPEELIEAYNEMDELNDEHIRKKYFSRRLKAFFK